MHIERRHGEYLPHLRNCKGYSKMRGILLCLWWLRCHQLGFYDVLDANKTWTFWEGSFDSRKKELHSFRFDCLGYEQPPKRMQRKRSPWNQVSKWIDQHMAVTANVRTWFERKGHWALESRENSMIGDPRIWNHPQLLKGLCPRCPAGSPTCKNQASCNTKKRWKDHFQWTSSDFPPKSGADSQPNSRFFVSINGLPIFVERFCSHVSTPEARRVRLQWPSKLKEHGFVHIC